MLGSLGKQFAGDIAKQVEKGLGEYMNSKGPKKTERATESLGTVHGHRRALFVGINYFGQNGELKVSLCMRVRGGETIGGKMTRIFSCAGVLICDVRR